jgi:hypothetical protein
MRRDLIRAFRDASGESQIARPSAISPSATSLRRHGMNKSHYGGDYSFVNHPGKWPWRKEEADWNSGGRGPISLPRCDSNRARNDKPLNRRRLGHPLKGNTRQKDKGQLSAMASCRFDLPSELDSVFSHRGQTRSKWSISFIMT